MADEKHTDQSFANHGRLHPPYHFVLAPLTLVIFVVAVVWVVRAPGLGSVWALFTAIALAVVLALVRVYPLKLQDRVIRLEERLRLMALLPEGQRGIISKLTADQLVGLRFASDAELPGLAQRAVAEKLTRKEIKKSIEHWRGDDFRV